MLPRIDIKELEPIELPKFGSPGIRYIDRCQVLSSLKKGRFDDPEWHNLHLNAYKLILSQSREELMTLDQLRTKIEIIPHQIKTALRVKNELRTRALLADEVGLGKTIEAGIILKEYVCRALVKNCLILTPASLVEQWKREMEDKFGEYFITNYDDEFEGFDCHSKIISSIDTAKRPRNAKTIIPIHWDMLIVDEAHRLKNTRTVNYHFVSKIDCTYFLMLTATPVQNNLIELYNIVNLLKPGLLGTIGWFTHNFVTDAKARKVRNHLMLQDILSRVMIRTRRRETNIEFTERYPRSYRLDSTLEERRLYDAVTNFIRAEYYNLWREAQAGHQSISGAAILVLMNLQRQLCSSTAAITAALKRRMEKYPREEKALEHLLSLAEQVKRDTKESVIKQLINNVDSKILIFTGYLETQEAIRRLVFDEGLEVAIFNGSMSPVEKEWAIKMFQREVQVLVSTGALSEGRNLQFCNVVLNYDLPWNPMRVEQRIGRVHRIGQKQDVYIHNLVVKDTIEDYILETLYDKINLCKMTLGDIELILGDTVNVMPKQIFETYIKAKSPEEAKRRLHRIGDMMLEEKKIKEEILQFSEGVLKHFNLSPQGEEA